VPAGGGGGGGAAWLPRLLGPRSAAGAALGGRACVQGRGSMVVCRGSIVEHFLAPPPGRTVDSGAEGAGLGGGAAPKRRF
jgi:hypothetical protein